MNSRQLLILAISAIGCSTTSKDVHIETNPAGSRIIIDGNYVGQSPLETEITREKFSIFSPSNDATFVKIYALPENPKDCMAQLTIMVGKPTPDKIYLDHRLCLTENFPVQQPIQIPPPVFFNNR